MKLMPVSFDPTKEPLLAQVVIHCRKQGNLAEAQKTSLLYDRILATTLMDPGATKEEKLKAVALVQAYINAHQRVIDLYMNEGKISSPSKEECDENDGTYDAY